MRKTFALLAKIFLLVATITVAALAIVLIINDNIKVNNVNEEKDHGSYPIISYTNTDSEEMPKQYLKYVRNDGVYEFSYPEDWSIVGDRMGTQSLLPLELEGTNLYTHLVVYSKELLIYTDLQDWFYNRISIDYEQFKSFSTNNGLEGASVHYVRSEYEDIMYAVKKEGVDVAVVVTFRLWSNFQGVYKDMSKYTSVVEEIVNSIEILK